MSRKLTLSVQRHGVHVDGPLPNRPVRRMPSGISGAVYFGDVYPLHTGDYIDLADESLPKSRCPDFVGAGEPIQYVQRAARPTSKPTITKWHVESNRFGHYLVFDATEKTAEHIAAILESSPLGLIRWGESYRAADDGYHYDWFARLDYDGTRPQCLQLLEQLLPTKKTAAAPAAKTAAVTAAPTVVIQAACDHLPLLEQAYTEIARLVQVEEQLGTLQDTQETLLAAAAQWQRAREVLQTKLTAAEADLDSSRKKEKKAAADLRKASKALKELQQTLVLGTGPASPLSPSPALTATSEADLQAKIKELQDESDTAQQMAEEAEAELVAARQQLAAATTATTAAEAAAVELIKRNQDLQGQVRNLQREHDQEQTDRQRVGGKARRAGNLEQVLSGAFPRLTFTSESIEELEGEFPNPRAVYDVLRRLDRDEAVPLTKVRPDLFKVDAHIATGNPACANMGRVYMRRLPDGQLCVFVHRKRNDNEQHQFLDRIAKRPIERLMASA